MPGAFDPAIDAYIQDHLDDSLAELGQLVRQPSVAAQGLGMTETADLVAALLERRGFKTQVLPTGGYPVVYGEAPGRSDRTLLLYNHYDVQPAEPLDLWESPPFEPEIRGDRYYGRGISDDKGHIVARLAALDALRAVDREYPCRIKFLIEGEEEIGSVNLPRFVRENRALLTADGCIWESGGVNHRDQPSIYCGMRGICYYELRVKTADIDAHSGLGGSIFPNAAWRLAWALAALKSPDGTIRLPGFYDRVRPPSEQDLELLRQLPPEDESYRQIYGVKRFLNDVQGVDLLREAVFSPSCTICGITTGYQGPGAKTVLPAEASAKIDFRLVPDQDADEITGLLRKHLDAEGFSDVELTVLGTENPARVDPSDPLVRLAVSSAEEVYGTSAVIEPIVGGSGPMYLFVQELELPIATAGISYPENFVHAPNEHIRIQDFLRGTRHTARIIRRFPDLPNG